MDIYNALNKGTRRRLGTCSRARTTCVPSTDHVPADSADRRHVEFLIWKDRSCASGHRFATSETHMTRRDESAGRRRREFLKVAGGVATALVATGDALGQGARPHSAAPAARRPAGPPDGASWVTWY